VAGADDDHVIVEHGPIIDAEAKDA